MLWLKAKALGVTPSSMLGIESGSYEAYCIDEAVVYYGSSLEHELEKAGHKPSREDRKIEAARQRVLDKWLTDDDEPKKQTGFADPALMFK